MRRTYQRKGFSVGGDDTPRDYEDDPEFLAILAKLERPWWRRPVTWVAGGVVLAGAFFGAGFAVGQDRSGAAGSAPAQSASAQPTPTGLSFAQKQQILFRYCTSSQMRGPAGDSSAFPTCMTSYYVTDQGMVMPK